MEAISVQAKTDEALELWQTFQENHDESTRERLVIQYMPLVNHIIARMFSHLPNHVSRDDLMSSGLLGLIDAIERYDLNREIKFETFAYPRIRGAILDELRAYDFLPRSVRLKMRKLQKAISELEGSLKRSPTEQEIAKKLGMGIEEYRELLKLLSPIRFYSLSDALNEFGEFQIQKDAIGNVSKSESPDLSTENQELRSALLNAIQKLPKNERLTVALYYYEEMTMKEIGVVLKVSESRVSQIHTQAILKLRSAVEKALL